MVNSFGGDMKKFLPVVMFLLLAPAVGWSQSVLQVNSLIGKVEIRPAAAKAFQPLTDTVRQVQVGDQIRTSAGASVVLTLPDQSYMRVNESTDLVIRDFWSGGTRSVVNVLLGRVRFFIEKLGGRPNPYRVETPTALIAVRGTTFDVAYDGQNTQVWCIDGQVAVETLGIPNREVVLNPGFQTLVVPGQAPITPTPVASNEEQPNRILRVVKVGPETEVKGPDPRVLDQLLRDNDRANRPTDRNKAPTSGTDSNVGRVKMTYPE
jgi:hypothetical protein